MTEWPYYLCQGCGKAALTSPDLTRAGCEGKHEAVIPADLGRELYEAAWPYSTGLYGKKKDRERLIAALMRYEREVGK